MLVSPNLSFEVAARRHFQILSRATGAGPRIRVMRCGSCIVREVHGGQCLQRALFVLARLRVTPQGALDARRDQPDVVGPTGGGNGQALALQGRELEFACCARPREPRFDPLRRDGRFARFAKGRGRVHALDHQRHHARSRRSGYLAVLSLTWEALAT